MIVYSFYNHTVIDLIDSGDSRFVPVYDITKTTDPAHLSSMNLLICEGNW